MDTNNGQYFKDILGKSDAILEEVQENANNVESLSHSEIETVEELCTPDFHIDNCTCFEKRAEEIKQMQAQLEKERQDYEMKKELRRKEREEAELRKQREEAERLEKEKKQKELDQLKQTINETAKSWNEKNTKRKQLEDEIKNLYKECDNFHDKYYELAQKYNKLSGTKKYKVPDTYESDKHLKNFVNKFANLYGDSSDDYFSSSNFIDYYNNTIKPYYYYTLRY